MGSHLDTSICSRSFSTQRSTNAMRNNSIISMNGSGCSTLPKPINERSIDNLIEWNCSAAIIKAYKKKGILEMFEWQVECLNRPKVTIFLQITRFIYCDICFRELIVEVTVWRALWDVTWSMYNKYNIQTIRLNFYLIENGNYWS